MLRRLPPLDIEGPPLTDPKLWQLKVDGLVERPKTYSMDDIRAFEPAEATVPFVCVEGWDLWAKWKGVTLKRIIEDVRPLPDACWLTFYAYSEYTDSLFIRDAMDERTMLAYGYEEGDLPAGERGAAAPRRAFQARVQIRKVAPAHQLHERGGARLLGDTGLSPGGGHTGPDEDEIRPGIVVPMAYDQMYSKRPGAVDRVKIHEAHTQVKDILGALVIRDGSLTLVTMQNGDIPIDENHGYGLYHRDCRFLSGYTLKCNGKAPTDILSSDEKGYACISVLTNQPYKDSKGQVVDKDTLSIRRDRIIPGILDEKITITNFNVFETTVELSMEFTSDFDDIFTVRGITKPTDGELLPPQYEHGLLRLRYMGQDGHHRNTCIAFDPQPAHVDGSLVTFKVNVKPREPQALHVRIYAQDSPPDPASMPGPEQVQRRIKGIKASYADTMECCSNIQTDNGIFNRVFLRSLSDLRMLYMGLPVDIFYWAGVPWYDALFGRDSIISAMQVIPYNPEVARSTLRVLASFQGRKVDDWRDEQPGKVPHELRVGEQANLNHIPDTPYYGSVDSTPLFLILIAEYIDWTGDMRIFHDLMGSVDAAIGWIDRYGDVDGSGFTSYLCRSPMGLYNQCWKDSWDSISHSDGSLAAPPSGGGRGTGVRLHGEEADREPVREDRQARRCRSPEERGREPPVEVQR